MSTGNSISYDRFLVTTVKNHFIPMYGCNFQDQTTQKMDNEYHISANLDRGLFLTSESHNNRLYESRLYYELNISKIDNDSDAINNTLDILKEVEYVSCMDSDNQSILAIKYDVKNGLVSHLNMLNKKGVFVNNPWKHLTKHNLEIIMFNEDRIKILGYHENNSWIDRLPKEVQRMIGYIK